MLFRRKRRPLRALQIEVTSRCTRSCAVCPRSPLADRWCEGDLDEAVWARLEPDLALAQYIHLQGWGEPLLHPLLPEMVRSAGAAGCTTGITTNGDLLDSAAEWIVDLQMDLVTVSVAGTGDTHSRLRGGSSFDAVMNGVSALVERARKHKSGTKVQISYLLTRKNGSCLPRAVEEGARAGAAELFVIHVDTTPSSQLLGLAAFGPQGVSREMVACLKDAKAAAKKCGIRFRGPETSPEELLTCSLDPLKFVFVSFDGRVGPCVNLLLPVTGEIPRYDGEGVHRVEPVCYGSLDSSTLGEILTGEARRSFTAPFDRRLEAEQEFLSSVCLLSSCRALETLDEAAERRSASLESSPFPRACTGCHKISGW